MIRYLSLNLIFLLALLLALKPWGYKRITKPVLITSAILLSLTAIFDSLIIYAKIVGYNPDVILGIRIGLAPVEDFFYTVASVLLVSILWEKYDAKK